MKLLVDTHVLVWMLAEPARIPASTLEQLRNPANELYVSAVSAFELATKYRIGKFPEAKRLLLAYHDFLHTLGATEIAITGHHGIVAGELTWNHRDPFDRLLAAQSVTESVTLVTSDPVFQPLAGVQTLWA